MNYQLTKSTFLSSLKTRAFCFALLLAALAVGSTVTPAQTVLPESASIGAADPLLENYQPQRLEFYNQAHGGLPDIRSNQRAAAPAAGELDALPNTLFDAASGSVNEIIAQPDGKLLVVGFFRTVNNARYKSIARLNADNTLDATFSANLNGSILAVALQADGKILIGGSFNIVNGANRNRLARLNADGSLDATFNVGTGVDNLVYDIAVQADGKILIGGNFARVNSVNRYAVARLDANGTPDESFTSPIPLPIPTQNQQFPAPSIVFSIALQTDGKIILGGLIVLSYTSTTPITTAISRLNVNGSFDASFNPGNINSSASKVAVQPDGKILLAGFFTLINNVSQRFVARLNADGSRDASFNTGTSANLPVSTLYLQPDGKILIGGRFSTFNGATRGGVARLNADGALDTAFVTTATFGLSTVQSVISTPNGRVLAGGIFGGAFNFVSTSIRYYNADGALDTATNFATTALGAVRAIAVQPDGKILVGGNFNRVGSVARNGLTRLNADGTLDESFNSSSNVTGTGTQINSIIVQPDGKIIIGGISIAVGNTVGFSIVRLNADGTNDDSFVEGNIPLARAINAMALQPDGKIVIVSGYNQTNGVPAGSVARVNTDGSLDTTFTLGIPVFAFNSVVIQTDGKIIVGYPGSFGFFDTQTGGANYNGLARLNANGSQDRAFVPAMTSDFQNGRGTEVYALTLQPDGKILVGGSLYTSGATTPTGVVRLNSTGTLDGTLNSGAISSLADLARVEDIQILPGGKLFVGGLFTNFGGASRINAARLNANGSIDNAFVADTDVYGVINDVAVQPSGKLLIGGDFETVNGAARTSLARLLSDTAARRTAFDFDGDGKADVAVFRPSDGTWYSLNSQTGFTGTQFGAANDKIAPADYDGDGKTDLAVRRGAVWYLLRSQAGFTGVTFGNSDDVAVPGDYDGDGKAEIAVYRPSNGVWYVYNLTTNQVTSVQFGQANDQPVAADYDGDGKTDYAVFRPSESVWYVLKSTEGFTGTQFGAAGDKLVPADYDGDGKTDLAVYRPSNGVWYLLRSTAGFTGIAFGLGTDVPTPADYDGDGKTDIAVFRPSEGVWYLFRSQSGFTGIGFGVASDQPVPNAFIP